VGFGIYGVWIALSTGTGFGPAQFALADFGYNQGWRVSDHVRATADVNGDGRQDIVGFGLNGVWIALSTGTGFGPAQFALADFGYNQGWKVGRHPRFVADLNGDGYQDIVGYGENAVYRALGGPGGFVGNRLILRDLTAGHSSLPPALTPRFIGDANGDGMQDLVVFDEDSIRVACSSELPPPPPPEAPTNPRIISKTETSLQLAWDDNSNNEDGFVIFWNKEGNGSQSRVVARNITYKTFNDLDPDTQYCFGVVAFNIFGESVETRRVCDRTEAREEEPPPTKEPSIFVSFGVYFPPSSWGSSKLVIKGGDFQPGETVLVEIVETVNGGQPYTHSWLITADSSGVIDDEYLGVSGGGACFPKETHSYKVQCTGLTTSKKSNVVVLGC
jgi:fibronectin type III domain protein/VCBS repeat protein